MTNRFSAEKWKQLAEIYRQWWNGTLERPIIAVRVVGKTDWPEPELQMHGSRELYDLGIPAEAVIDRWDFELSALKFMGDGFPCMWPNFGPGVLAAFIGCRGQPELDTTWFIPEEEKPIEEISFSFNPEAPVFRRVADLMKAAQERWGSEVLVNMTDLGGNLDILSSFRPSEQLVFDLYDHPEQVKRLTWEAHEAWWAYYSAFNEVLQPVNPGYSAWTNLYSESPYYILQCDFCYMIGPEMFDEFVKPELAASCKRLSNAFYHLDGPGQLPHLDSLLSIPELKGIQWIPGAGQPDETKWPEVYGKIRDAGKLIQVFGRATSGQTGTLTAIADQLDSAKGIALIADVYNDEQLDEAITLLEHYGIDP